VLEKRASPGDLQVIDDITAQYKREIHRMKFLLDAMQPQGVQRIRKLEDGDEIDINAAIASFIDIRLGNQPDPRIMMRSVRKTRDFSILVLLDLSESTNEKVQDQEYSVLELTRRPACCWRCDQQGGRSVRDSRLLLGWPPRRRVHPLQGLRPALDEGSKAKSRRHDRPALHPHGRGHPHAGHHLKQQRSAKKLLIVITDGEPPTSTCATRNTCATTRKRRVEEVAKFGVTTYCMSLDPRADNYVSRIFGQKNYMVVDHVQRLPEKLPLLYAGLTR